MSATMTSGIRNASPGRFFMTDLNESRLYVWARAVIGDDWFHLASDSGIRLYSFDGRSGPFYMTIADAIDWIERRCRCDPRWRQQAVPADAMGPAIAGSQVLAKLRDMKALFDLRGN
jgi:hypothetical protein